MKNYAAMRRKSRRIDRQRIEKGQAAAGSDGPPSGTLVNCVAERGGMGGIHVGPGAHVVSVGGIYRNNGGLDVDNHGRFDSYGDQIGTDERS